ncbi:MAG: Maf family protein, partial [Chlamydiia bacterium]|nr:Maf family protein [Chlamydiia bacterium]
YVQRLAEEKGASIAPEFDQSEIILTADTVVVKDGQIFSKPQNLEEAFSMLFELAGKTHVVHSGISVRRGPTVYSAVESTEVTFCPLTEAQIRKFHTAIDPTDKAGAYAIQGSGGLLIKKIHGNYDNVMGLPMQTVAKLLKNVGIDLWDYVSSSSL